MKDPYNPYTAAHVKLANLEARFRREGPTPDRALLSLVQIKHEFVGDAGEMEAAKEKAQAGRRNIRLTNNGNAVQCICCGKEQNLKEFEEVEEWSKAINEFAATHRNCPPA
jgi:hypothetical protein